jgi:hypothetical protein
MPGTGVSLHGQAGLAIRLSAVILKCFEKENNVGIVLVALTTHKDAITLTKTTTGIRTLRIMI